MATSRETILAAVRARHRPGADLPALDATAQPQPWTTYADLPAQFAAALQIVGGRCHQVPGVSAIDGVLAGIPEIASARLTVSLVHGVGRPNVELHAIADPHELEPIDVAIMPGEFGVAENGAIWVTSRDIRHRAIYIIVQHLVLVIHADTIVQHMHAAYDRAVIGGSDWGAFLCGPSKTADIEQSLVVGAHGPRSLDVFVVG